MCKGVANNVRLPAGLASQDHANSMTSVAQIARTPYPRGAGLSRGVRCDVQAAADCIQALDL